MQIRLAEVSLTNAFKKLRAARIEPILIKGWATSRSYPKNHFRIFEDVDLCVDPLQYQKAKEILERNPSSFSFMPIDLHKGLRHLDNVEWGNLYDNSRLVKIEEISVRVLRPEDHLRVICNHWLNDGGIRKERLWDIYYAIENRPKNFEWERFLDIVGEKRKKWLICALGITAIYLGLDLSRTPVAKESENIPKWIIKTIENEWKTQIPLKPLMRCLDNRKELLEQIKKRFPPNALQATIELEGEFDNTPRIFYQIGDIFYRMPSSMRQVSGVLYRKFNKK